MAKSPFRRFTVSLDVTVTDARAAIKAARADAKAQGLTHAVNNTSEAVHWLLDPGSMFEAGIEIDESRIEENTL